MSDLIIIIVLLLYNLILNHTVPHSFDQDAATGFLAYYSSQRARDVYFWGGHQSLSITEVV